MDATTQQATTDVRILKAATCASTSGKSKLTYEVGCTPDSEVHVRITANTGSGAISKNWVSLQAIREVLKGAPPGELTSGHMAVHRPSNLISNGLMVDGRSSTLS